MTLQDIIEILIYLIVAIFGVVAREVRYKDIKHLELVKLISSMIVAAFGSIMAYFIASAVPAIPDKMGYVLAGSLGFGGPHAIDKLFDRHAGIQIEGEKNDNNESDPKRKSKNFFVKIYSKIKDFIAKIFCKDCKLAADMCIASKDKGLIEFPSIVYTKSGTYHYTIHEISEPGDGWETDKREFHVVVTVTDDGKGNLIPSIEYPDGFPEFVNVYKKK